MNKINVYKKIDEVVKAGPSHTKREELLLLTSEEDSRNYFYSGAGEMWLSWLWENHFLDPIKEKVNDQNIPTNQLPELFYLSRISEKAPEVVAKILLDIPVSSNSNQMVVAQFFRIISEMPAKELPPLIQKMSQENWLPVISRYGHIGFDFERMFRVLVEVSDWESVLSLSQMLLLVKEKPSNDDSSSWADNPFYCTDLEYSGVFNILCNIEDAHLEQSLALVSETMGSVVHYNADKREPREAFKVGDGFAFYEIDFFTLETSQKRHTSYRDDVRNLAATLKKLCQRVFEKNKENEKEVRRIYSQYIETLPDSQAMWRFRLFVRSLNSEIFHQEIKDAIFRIGKVARPHDLTSPEYKRLLQQNLKIFSEKEKQDYKSTIFKLIEDENEGLSKYDAYSICSSIFEWLTDEEKGIAANYSKHELDPTYVPETTIHSPKGGTVRSLSPISDNELQKSVSEIAKSLRNEWAPQNLGRKDDYKEDSIDEYGPEGLANKIKEKISERLQEFIDHAQEFFEPGTLDEHYTYTFIGGVRDAFGAGKFESTTNWDGLMKLFSLIVNQGRLQNGKWRREEFLESLAGWTATYSVLAELINELVKVRKDKTRSFDFTNNRDQVLEVIRYLLAHPDPTVESEVCTPKIKNASDTEDEVKYDCSDPFTHAINSVRGKAFEALINFMYRDGEKLSKENTVLISDDVKKVYEELLEHEDTRAVRFLFGHYLPSVYFRDKAWADKVVIPRLFDFENNKDLSLASWEGYLANNVYRDLFLRLELYYLKNIQLKREEYTPREYFKNLDEGMATHIAIAFMHFPEIALESNVFKTFWKEKNVKRQSEFISFVGRYAISRDNAAEWIKTNGVDKDKVEAFWDWLLSNTEIDQKVFEAFGFWMDAEWKVFDPSWQAEYARRTLEKTRGVIDWDYNLQQSLPVFVKVAPQDTLAILRLYLLDYLSQKMEHQGYFHLDDEITEVFEALYNNPDTKQGVYDLIDALLPRGNGAFWKLKDVLKD